MPTVSIFGATGTTGICCVAAALDLGLKVKTFVRDPSKIPADQQGKTEVIVGDVQNIESVLNAVEGSDFVVVALGTRNNLDSSTVMSDGLNNILTSMKQFGVTKVSVCLSAFLFYPVEKVPPAFHNIDKDHRRMLKMLQDSEDLDWVAVFPPHIEDGQLSDTIITIGEHPGHRIVSKHNLGKFLVTSVQDPKYYKQTVGIANKP